MKKKYFYEPLQMVSLTILTLWLIATLIMIAENVVKVRHFSKDISDPVFLLFFFGLPLAGLLLRAVAGKLEK